MSVSTDNGFENESESWSLVCRKKHKNKTATHIKRIICHIKSLNSPVINLLHKYM